MTETYAKTLNIVPNNFKYEDITFIKNRDFLIATLNGKIGLLDTNGNPISEFIYDNPLYDDVLWYEFIWCNKQYHNKKYCNMSLNNKWGIIDFYGNTIIDFKYSNPIEIWGENFIIELNKEIIGENHYYYLIMDKNQNIHLDLNFDYVNTRGNFAIVEKNYKHGIINRKLQFLTDLKYDNLFAGDNYKYISASINNKSGVIDLKENIILDFLYDYVEIEKLGNRYLFKTELNNKFALFNEAGERIG